MSTGVPRSRFSSRVLTDIAFGVLVMGTVGTMIGMILGGQAHLIGAGIGSVLGTVVGVFGGRRFLISILIGTVLGGALAWALVGAEKITVGAGAGAAMGGFLGVQVSMLLDMRAERKRAGVTNEPEEGKEVIP